MYTTNRSLPVNFIPQDEYLFTHELQRSFPESKEYILRGLIIDSNGTIISYKNLPKEIIEKSTIYKLSFFNYWIFIAKLLLKGKLKLITKSIIWFTDTWSNGYFHWMMDALPRLCVAQNKLKRFSMLLPKHFDNQSYIHASLSGLGLKDIHYMNDSRYYFFVHLHFQTHTAPTGNYHDETVQQLRHVFSENLQSKTINKGERIYISRTKAQRRKITNEKKLIDLLSKHNFEIVHFEDYSWEQQVSICSNAKIMIGLHGAGLTNMLFMPEGSKVIELRKSGDSHNNCYFSLASALKHNYYYLQCNADKEDVLEANFTVELNEINRLFQNLNL